MQKEQDKVFEKRVRHTLDILKRNRNMGIDADTVEGRHSIAYYNSIKPNVMAEAVRRYRRFIKKETV